MLRTLSFSLLHVFMPITDFKRRQAAYTNEATIKQIGRDFLKKYKALIPDKLMIDFKERPVAINANNGVI